MCPATSSITCAWMPRFERNTDSRGRAARQRLLPPGDGRAQPEGGSDGKRDLRERAEEKLYTRLGELRQMAAAQGHNPLVAVAGCWR